MTKQDPTCICFEEFLNQKPFESNFQFSVAEKSFPILFSFLFWPASIPSLVFLAHLILSAIFFSLAQSVVQSNHTFGPSTQFPLVIFDFQTPDDAFGLPGHYAALHCVIRLRHRGAASPSPPLPLRKRSHPIASSSPFRSPVTNIIEVPPPLPPSP
jgi:hypothetical protein